MECLCDLKAQTTKPVVKMVKGFPSNVDIKPWSLSASTAQTSTKI